jgi:hypothetical protein
VTQYFTDGSSIQSNWVAITLQQIPQTPSNLFYPNPASEQIMFYQKGNYKIYNMKGALVKEFNIDIPSTLIIANLPRGIYTIKFNSGNNQSIERLIKN